MTDLFDTPEAQSWISEAGQDLRALERRRWRIENIFWGESPDEEETPSTDLGLSQAEKDEEHQTKFLCPRNDGFYASGIYKALDPEKREIRLITLLPRSDGRSQVRCEFVGPVSLDENFPSFEALSYCAGNPEDTQSIQLNGVDFNVFASLGAALSRLQTSEPRLLWIDQVCINQSESAERATQVQFMRDIYIAAAAVVIWLGNQEHNRLGMWLAEELYEFYENLLITIPLTPGRDAREEQLKDFLGTEKLAVEEAGHYFWTQLLEQEKLVDLAAFSQICQSRWWRRCWVQQECIVARVCRVSWGESQLRWEAIGKVMEIIFKLGMRLKTPEFYQLVDDEERSLADIIVGLGGLAEAHSIFQQQEHFKKNYPLRLRELLFVNRALECGDPRDKVYSVIGLADPDYGIAPSYQAANTTVATFTAAVKAIILQDQNLDILGDGQEPGRHATLNLPSWVPDFTVTGGREHLPRATTQPDLDVEMPGSADWVPFQASKDLLLDLRFEADAEGPDRILSTRAIKLGEISDGKLGAVPRGWDDTLASFTLLARAREIGAIPPRAPEQHEAFRMCAVLGDMWDLKFRSAGEAVGAFESADSVYMQNIKEKWSKGYWRLVDVPQRNFGVVPAETQVGDLVCVCFGSKAPSVIREIREGGGYTLIGAAYVYKDMHGEAVDDWRAGRLEDTWVSFH